MSTDKMNPPSPSPCDKDLNYCSILRSIIRALECPDYEKYPQRLLRELNRLFIAGGNTVQVHDLGNLTKLISLIFDRMSTNDIYEDYFYKVLYFCSQNFVFAKTSEIIKFADKIEDFFNMLGFVLGITQNINIIRAVLNAIIKILSAAEKKPFLQSDVVLECFARCQTPSIIAELLVVCELDTYVECLIAIEQMFDSKIVCQSFLKCNILDTIMKRICYNWRDYVNYRDEELPNLPLPKHLNLSQRIMWTLAVAYNDSSKAFKDSMTCILQKSTWRSGRNILIALLTSNEDRHMRNVFYLLLRTIGTMVPYEYYVPLINEIHLLAFTTEVPQSHQWAPHMILRPDRLDFEFKVLLLSVLCQNREHPQNLDTFRRMNALQGIYTLLDLTQKLIWTPYQRLELMKCALIGMENIIPYVVDDFVQSNGPQKLLNVIANVLNSTLPFSLLLPSLRCINTSLNVQQYPLQKMGKHYRMKGIIELFGVLLDSISKSSDLTKMNLMCLAVCYCILEKVAKKSEDKLVSTTRISVEFLHRFLNPTIKDTFLPPKVLIAVMSFLWRNVIHCNNGLAEFVSLGGVFAILDIIEKFPLAIKLLGLSMLCELCEMPQCLACVLTWRGSTGQTIVPFLLKIYLEQSQFDKDHCQGNATIQDIENPLMGEKHRNIRLKYQNNEYSSIAAMDMLGNCKPKIYAILCLLSCSEEKELIDSNYEISKKSLSNKEKVVAILAENYLPLKVGETWVEVDHHFECSGIRPLVFDQEVIAIKIRQYRNRTKYIQMQQFFYQTEDNKNDLKVERELYNQLREEVLCESLEALQELEYYAKCVDRMFRLEECTEINKETQKALSERVDPNLLIDFHKTLPQYSNNTNIFNQRVSIQSNVIIDPNKVDPPDPVSLESITECSHSLRKFETLASRNATSYDVTRPIRDRYYSVDYH